MTKNKTLTVRNFSIDVEFKRMKNIYLRVKPDGQITISAPTGTSDEFLISFVNSRTSWINSKQMALKELREKTDVLQPDEILLFGTPVKNNLSNAAMQRLLHEKIEAYTKKYWEFFKSRGCTDIEIKYRVMKNTWGICRPTAKTITYNKLLVHQPLEFIEYVVIHELCHLLIPNHSRDFWLLVASFMPNFKAIEQSRILV